jgi:hypothetical protein
MPDTIKLSPFLGTITEDGTWEYEGDAVTPPVAPIAWDGDADFSGVSDPGIYRFKYTVESDGIEHSAYVDVTYGTTENRPNDDCATAFIIAGTNDVPYDISLEETNTQDCENGIAAPTAPAIAYPVTWSNMSGDLWYQFQTPSHDRFYTVFFQIDGESYGSDGASKIGLQIYTHNVGQNCGDIVEVYAGYTPLGSTMASITIPAYTTKVIRFRIATKEEYEGKFTIRIYSIC